MPSKWINNAETQRIVIIGAGGFGREVVSFILDINAYAEANGLPRQWEILGVVDDGEPDLAVFTKLGVEFLGGSDTLATLPENTHYVVTIGNGVVRRSVSQRADAAGLIAATIVHPSANIGALVTIGEGTVICPGAALTCNIVLGKHSQINLNATVGHEAVLHDYATVFPLNAISGFVTLGEACTIGANSVINPGVTVGEGAFVGSGAAVTKDVEPFTLVAGVPAKFIKPLK